MVKRIDVPGMGLVEFPDNMTDDQIVAAIRQNMPQQAPTPKAPSAYDEGRQASGALQGLHSALQGPTLGFADEIYGGLAAVGKSLLNGQPFSEAYRESRDFARGASDAQAEQNPKWTAVTRIAASAPLAAITPFGAGAAPVGIAGQAGRAAVSGAAYGGANALGTSTAKDARGAALDAAKGAGMGAVLGAGMVPVAKVVGAVTGNVAARVSDSQAGKYAQAKLAEALSRDARGKVAQESLTGPLEQAQARLRKLGPEARVADAGGANTRQLLDTLAILPGKTKEATEAAIRSRQAGRAARLIGSAEKQLGAGGKRLASSLDDWMLQRKQQAAPLYDQVRRIPIAPDDDLARIVSAADQLGATGMAKKIATAEMQKFTLNAKQPATWSMADLDRVKQGLDAMIAKNVNPATGETTPLGRSLLGLKHELTGKLDAMTGGLYAQARAAYAGPSALMDAAKAGRTAMTKDDASIRQMMAGLQGSELDAFRLGAFESLRAKLGREAGQTEILKMWKEPATQERLRAMFGTEREFRQFAATAARESRLKMLEGTGRGSQTAARMYGAGDLDVAALQDMQQAVSSATTGNLPGMLAGASSLWSRVKTPEPVRDAMGQMLLSRGADGAKTLEQLQDVAWRVQQQRLNNAARMGLLAGPGANAAGALLGQ